jgi:hypothetical protein
VINLIKRGKNKPEVDNLSDYQLGFATLSGDLYIRAPIDGAYDPQSEIIYLGGKTISGIVNTISGKVETFESNKLDKTFIADSLKGTTNRIKYKSDGTLDPSSDKPGTDNKLVQDIKYTTDEENRTITIEKTLVSAEKHETDIYETTINVVDFLSGSLVPRDIAGDGNKIVQDIKYELDGSGDDSKVHLVKSLLNLEDGLIDSTTYSGTVDLGSLLVSGKVDKDFIEKSFENKRTNPTTPSTKAKNKIVQDITYELNSESGIIYLAKTLVAPNGKETDVYSGEVDLVEFLSGHFADKDAFGNISNTVYYISGDVVDISGTAYTASGDIYNVSGIVNSISGDYLSKTFVNDILEPDNPNAGNGIVQDVKYTFLNYAEHIENITSEQKTSINETYRSFKEEIKYVSLEKKIIHPDDPEKTDTYSEVIPYVPADVFVSTVEHLEAIAKADTLFVVDKEKLTEKEIEENEGKPKENQLKDLSSIEDPEVGYRAIVKEAPDGNSWMYFYVENPDFKDDPEDEDEFIWKQTIQLSTDLVDYIGNNPITITPQGDGKKAIGISTDFSDSLVYKDDLDYYVVRDVEFGVNPPDKDRWTKTLIKIKDPTDAPRTYSGSVSGSLLGLAGNYIAASGVLVQETSTKPELQFNSYKYEYDYLSNTLASGIISQPLFTIDLSALVIDEGTWD